MRKYYPLQTLTIRISATVILMLVVFAITLGWVVYDRTVEGLERSTSANLEALASARKKAVEIQLGNYLDCLEMFAQPDIDRLAASALAVSGPERMSLITELRNILRKKSGVLQFIRSVMIVDASGHVIVASLPELEGQDVSGEKSFSEWQIRPHIGDPFMDAGTLLIDLVLPLNDSYGALVAILMLRFDAAQIQLITGDYTGLGRTGETVLGARVENDIVFLAPRRFGQDLANVAPLPVSEESAIPMQRATAGQSGVIAGLDYRRERVVAAYRQIQPTGWGVVVKQDESEAYAGLHEMRTAMMVRVGFVILAALVFVGPMVRVFVRPLRELELASQKVASGDLTTELPISQMDEVGRLADSFNKMVVRLREARGELAKSNEDLASFAYVVSHDLKTPLRGIATLSEWLEEDVGDRMKPDEKQQVALLRERVHRMDALINDLLEYSRIGRTGKTLDFVDIGRLLQRVIDSVAPPDNIQVEVNLPMPGMITDEIRLNQVFQNLIDNAVKHHPGPHGRVDITCRDVGEMLEFSVADDGAGIERRHHDRIFQMFQSLSGDRDVDSTGIGLALVRKILEELGGKIWIESEGIPGKGSTFIFTIPKNENMA